MNGVPTGVEPAAGPAPPAVASAIDAEEETIAVAVAQNRSGKLEPSDTEGLVQPFERHLAFFFEETLADLRVQADVLRGNVSRELLFASDDSFAFFNAVLEEHFGEVNLDKFERPSVLCFFARESIAVFWPAPDRPAATDELGRVKRFGAIDDEKSGTFRDEACAVFQKQREASTELDFRHLDDAFLKCIAVELTPVGITENTGTDFIRLVA